MSYSDILSLIMAYLEPCVTHTYSEPYHIPNPGVFSTLNLFRTPSKHILASLERCVALAY